MQRNGFIMSKKVVVYSKPNCAQCNFTKKFLDNNGIDYQTIDVYDDEKALQLLKDKGLSSMPVVSINDFEEHWTGFRPDELAKIK